MFKSFKIFLFYVFLLSFTKSLKSFDSEKIIFSPDYIRSYSNELKSGNDSDSIEINFDVDESKDMIIGDKGVLHFKSSFNDTQIFDLSTLEKDTSFTTAVIDENNNVFNASCRLWITSESNVSLFCNLDGKNFGIGNHSITIDNQTFQYGNTTVKILFPKGKKIPIIQYDFAIPFLYSDIQKININGSQDTYDIKFKIENYNETDILYIHGTKYNYAILEGCKINDKELICQLSKNKIEEILILQEENFSIGTMNDHLGLIKFDYVSDINIKYIVAEKEDVYIHLEKLVGQITESGTPFAFETNITKFPNFISNLLGNIFYFKKMSGKPLMIFVEYPYNGSNISIPSYPEGSNITNLHYKYNFRIAPFEFKVKIDVRGYGTNVLLSYPEKFDFDSSDSNVIRYIMTNPTLARDIKLNLDSKSILECEDLNMMKKCTVPKSHFDGQDSGTFNTYHLNYDNNYNIYYDAPLFNVTLSNDDDNTTKFYIESEDNEYTKYIGLNGILNVVLNYNDSETNIFDASDLEEKSQFETTILIDNKNSFKVTCCLWKPVDEKLNMFCKFNTSLEFEKHSFKISSSSFDYKDKKYKIISKADLLNVVQLNETIPFLYSGKQVINVEEKTKIYDIKLKIGEYHNEPLLIAGHEIDSIILNNCSTQEKELICKITKAEIEEFVASDGEKLGFSYLIPSLFLIADFKMEYNYGIYINYPLNKENIYVGITKLLEKNIDDDNFLAYETNVTEIQNVSSKRFDMHLKNGKEIRFFLKKYEGIPLILIFIPSRDFTSLDEIDSQIELKDINIKYNFFIQPVINEEKCSIEGQGSNMMLLYPKILDFTLNDSVTVDFALAISASTKKIRINPDGNDLECKEINMFFKRCTVPITHFQNKLSGYYFTYHLNHLNKPIIFYESPTLKVILPETKNLVFTINEENNPNPIKLGTNGGVFAVTTNYNDKERNVFNNSEVNTFQATLLDINDINNKYYISCRLWRPNDDKMRIICNMNNALDAEKMLIFNNTSIKVNNYTITIEQKVAIKYQSYTFDIPMLYSDKHIININENQQTYDLKFKIEQYNSRNNFLYIYGSYNNYASLENCQNDEKEIKCQITKEKIEEILTSQNEVFKIGVMNDNLGIIPFDHILDIIVNYENVQKQDVYLSFTEIIGAVTEVGTPLTYETNITDFPTFTSQKFNNTSYFKKIPGRKLLYFVDYTQKTEEAINTANVTEEQIIKGIHYKYNFRIQPSFIYQNISVNSTGTKIFLTYPQKLDFSSFTIQYIRFIMSEPKQTPKFGLIPDGDSTQLICQDLYKMKRCTVMIGYLEKTGSKLYDIYYSNHLNQYSIYYDSVPINVTLPYELVEINVDENDNKNVIDIGVNGIVYLKTNYNDSEKKIFNIPNLEQKTSYNSLMGYDVSNSTSTICHLWKNKDGTVYIFCKLNKNLGHGEHKINFYSGEFTMNNYKIKINIKDKNFRVKQYDIPFPFLYSDEQEINIEEGNDKYYLKFKIEDYNSEKMLLKSKIEDGLGNIFLDECSIENKELTCEVKKSEFEEAGSSKYELYFYIDSLSEGFLASNLTGNINVKYSMPKINVKVTIKKLIDNKIDLYNFIAYEMETDVENITNTLSETFLLNYCGKWDCYHINCYLKQLSEEPLYLVCLPHNSSEGNFSLEQSTKEEVLNEHNLKYNFLIQPINNKEVVEIKGNSGSPYGMIPKKLDFYTNDIILVDVITALSNNMKGIKLNLDSKDYLQCESSTKISAKCIVPRSHFEKKQSGHYFMYHSNHLDQMIRFYQLSPFEVILPKENELVITIKKENNKNAIKIGKEGNFALITDYNDKDKNVFNNVGTIDLKISGKIKDEKNNLYEATCKLWEPTDENIRIICKLNQNLKNTKQNIMLEQITTDFGNYKIIIRQVDYIEVTQYNYDLPFLYADKTNIQVSSNEQNYKLKFNAESFNNDILFIYGDRLSYELLDNCKLNNKELTCDLSLQKIEGILTLNNSTFKIGAMNDNIGLISFDNIFNITINYPITQKEDIFVELTKIIIPNPEAGVYFGFETNVTQISTNINSAKLNKDGNCYFRKTIGNPLLLLCLTEKDYPFTYNSNDSEENHNTIHYKYNFRIQPHKNSTEFSVRKYGTDVKLIYPENLDFTSKDTLTIRFIMGNTSLSKNIKLNNDSSYLTCEDLEGYQMKKCTVTKEHFLGKKSGAYRPIHSNHNDVPVEYYESSSFKVTLPKENIAEIYVTDEENKEVEIGNNGIIYFITKYKDEKNILNGNDIEEKTEFNTVITDKYANVYKTTCRLWKPAANENIRIFCKLNNYIVSDNIKLISAYSSYNNNKLGIISQMNFEMKVKQLIINPPFIYSYKQTINVEKSKNIYEIKFKALEYNDDQLMLANPPKDEEEELNNYIFESCNLKGNDLTCLITREKIEQILVYSGQEFKINYINFEKGKLGVLNNVYNIKINYNSLQKENVYINLTLLYEDKISTNNYIAYETNVTTIDPIITNKFIYQNIPCLMKKDEEKPLLVICKFVNESQKDIGNIEQEIKLDNISAKYNLLIQPRKANETITVNGISGNILFATPMVLDFNTKDEINIIYYINNNNDYNSIRLNPDSENDLSCIKSENMKKCLVTIKHFTGKQSGYYYTHHKNSFAKYLTSYELSPIKVIIPDKNETLIRINIIDNLDSIKIGQKGTISFITNFNDTQNIFEASDIEKTSYKIPFLGSDNKNYTADCHFWEPKGEKLRLICSFNENINAQKLTLNKYSFTHNENKFAIISESDLYINQLSSNISFLYSDKQVININDKESKYILTLKKKIYNKEPLILYKGDNSIQSIYLNCTEETKEIKCTLQKNKLVEILSKNGDKYYLAQLSNSEGIITFNNVLDIIINYESITKKIININITNLLTTKVERNSFIVLETNNTDNIPAMITDYFSITPNRNEDMKCLFKKNSYEKGDKLYLLCKTEFAGEYQLDISENNLDDLNILYSFRIPETHISEVVTVSDNEGTKIFSVYPQSLDFTSNDNLIIKYQVENPEILTGIKLNINSTSELKCKNNNGIKECTVPKSHFNESGNYYTYYTNSFGDTVTSYEIPKIKIVLDSNSGNSTNSVAIIVGCVVGGILLIAIIVLIVVYAKRKNSDLDEFSKKGGGLLPINEQVELIEGDKFE